MTAGSTPDLRFALEPDRGKILDFEPDFEHDLRFAHSRFW